MRISDWSSDVCSSDLWINRWGTPASEHVIRDQIEKRTSDAFGRHVWPHLFRAIAGTGFVDHAPAQMALLPDLLGHRTVQTSHRYYVLSNGMMAHTAVQSTVAQRRSAARARRDWPGKENDKCRGGALRPLLWIIIGP